MDLTLKNAILAQKITYRVEESIADSESFQNIYYLLWLFFNRLEGYVPQIALKDLKAI